MFGDVRSPPTPSKTRAGRRAFLHALCSNSSPHPLQPESLSSSEPQIAPPPLHPFCVSHSHPSLRAAPVLLLLLRVRQMMATDPLVRALCGTRRRPGRPCEATSSPPSSRSARFLRLLHVFNTRQQDANKVLRTDRTFGRAADTVAVFPAANRVVCATT